MNSSMTPPQASRSRSSSVDSDFDEAYFFKTYVPLSNLPTPPLSFHTHSSSRSDSVEAFFANNDYLDPDLLGPATHLTNLIPKKSSLTEPSVPLVHSILTRAELPLETIALAVCILDSLASRFALGWRQGLPLSAPYPELPLGQFDNEREKIQHIDSVHPEIMVLAALVLAVKFLDDQQRTTRQYVSTWGKDLWTWDQLNFTQRSILENLGYRLLPLWDGVIIQEALTDMERAGRQLSPELCANDNWEADTFFQSFGSNKNGNENGHRVSSYNDLTMTPADTPITDTFRGTRDLPLETRTAFQYGRGTENETLQLPNNDNMDYKSLSACHNPMVVGM